MPECFTRDVYDFPLPDMTEEEVKARMMYHERAATRDSEWREYCENHVIDRHPSGLLKDMVRRGVPISLRPKVWMTMSGATGNKKKIGDGYYGELLEKHALGELVSKSEEEIDRDIHRTYPEHPLLQTEEGIDSLRKVLLAFSLHDPKVGYCQSMNFLVGFLLVVLGSEENSFWVLVSLLEDKIHPEMYERNLKGCHVEQRVLKELIDRKMPKVGHHLDALQCDMVMLTTEWFMCIYLNCLPVESAARVWDALISEGAKVLFRVALALIQLSQESILATEDVLDIMNILKEAASKQYDPDLLLDTAFNNIGSLSMDTINSQRYRKGKSFHKELKSRFAPSSAEDCDSDNSVPGTPDADKTFGIKKTINFFAKSAQKGAQAVRRASNKVWKAPSKSHKTSFES